MKPVLFLAFVLLAAPALAADAAPVLELKYSQAEAEADPSLAALKAAAEKASAQEKILKDKQKELTNQNTSMTAYYTKTAKDHLADPKDRMAFIHEYEEKFEHMNEDIRALHKQLPTVQAAANDARQAFNIAAWEKRIDDKTYAVFATGSTQWQTNRDNPERLEKRVILFDGQGKKFFLVTPQNIDLYSSQECIFWLGRELVAVHGAEVLPPQGNDPPSLKVANLNQLYFVERGRLPRGCPFGIIAEVAPKK